MSRLFTMEEVAEGDYNFVWGNAQFKEIIDDKTGQKMTLRFVNLKLQSPEGKTYPVLIEAPLHHFKGMKKENRNVTSLTIYDTDNPEVVDMIETTSHTQRKGYAKKTECNLVIEIEEKTATSKDGELQVYDSPGGDPIFQVGEEEELIVYGQKKSGSTTWLQVKTRGKKGHIQKIHDKMAQVIFNKKEEVNLGSKETVEDIQAMFKHPVYWAKKDGEYDREKKPSSFIKIQNYEFQDRKVTADICLKDDPSVKLWVEDFGKCNWTARPVFNMGKVLVGSDRINPQTKLVSALVEKLEIYERKNLQQDTIDRLGIDEEQLRKNMEILRQSRKESSQQSSPTSEEPKKETRDDEDIDEILGSASGMENVEIEPENEDFPVVPGLDD